MDRIAYGLIFVSPLIIYRHQVLGVNVNLQRLFLGIGIAIWFIHLTTRASKPLRIPFPLVVLLSFIVLKIADLIRSQKIEFAVRQISILVVGWFIMAFLVASINNRSRMKRAMAVFIVASLIPVALGVYQLSSTIIGYTPVVPFGTYFSPREPDDPRMLDFQYYSVSETGQFIRVSGTFGPPMFGEYLTVVSLILIPVVVLGTLPPRIKMAAITYVMLCVTLLIATFSRSAWILFAVGIGIEALVLIRFVGVGRVAAVSLIGGALLIPALYLLVPLGVIGDVFLSLFKLEDAGVSISDHVRLRAEAVSLFGQSPIFGVGLGNYGAITGQGGLLSSAHATFFTEAAEGGLVGVLILGIFAASILAGLWQCIRSHGADGEMGPLVIGLFCSTFAHVFNNLGSYNTFYFDHSWTLLGLATCGATVLRIREVMTRLAKSPHMEMHGEKLG